MKIKILTRRLLFLILITGSSERGSRMYAGMDCRNGNLVAIAEWDFYTKLDKKNRAPKSFGGISEGITTDNLLKQVRD